MSKLLFILSVSAFICGTATAETDIRLQSWLNSCKPDQALFQDIKSGKNVYLGDIKARDVQFNESGEGDVVYVVFNTSVATFKDKHNELLQNKEWKVKECDKGRKRFFQDKEPDNTSVAAPVVGCGCYVTPAD